MRELKGEHHHRVVEISENAGKCLEEEYLVSSHEKQQVVKKMHVLQLMKLHCTLKVDEPSCSTLRRRQIDLPSVESIEELRTPDYDELLKSFWETRGTWEQANGGSRHLPEAALEPLIGRN